MHLLFPTYTENYHDQQKGKVIFHNEVRNLYFTDLIYIYEILFA